MSALHPALVGIALAAAGCGSTSPADGACGPGPELAGSSQVDASVADVRAVLAGSCALGGCHASAPGAGELVITVSAPTWVDDLVGVPSHENPSMRLVAASDPEASWVVHKITGDLCGFACDPKLGCGARMPFGEPLAATDRDTIVAWIEHGAPRD